MYALINWWQYNWQPYQRNAFGKFYRFPYTSSPISGVTWAPDSRSISTPSLPLNGIWQLRVSDFSVGLHTKSTLNTFVVQLYPHRVIFAGLSKTILIMASYDSGHPSSKSYWAWVIPSESPYCYPKGDFIVVHYEPNCFLKGDFTMVRYEPYCFSTLVYNLRERFTYCSRPWRMKAREMSYLELYYYRPWRSHARGSDANQVEKEANI